MRWVATAPPWRPASLGSWNLGQTPGGHQHLPFPPPPAAPSPVIVCHLGITQPGRAQAHPVASAGRTACPRGSFITDSFVPQMSDEPGRLQELQVTLNKVGCQPSGVPGKGMQVAPTPATQVCMHTYTHRHTHTLLLSSSHVAQSPRYHTPPICNRVFICPWVCCHLDPRAEGTPHETGLVFCCSSREELPNERQDTQLNLNFR